MTDFIIFTNVQYERRLWLCSMSLVTFSNAAVILCLSSSTLAGRGGHRRVLSHIPRGKNHTVSGQVIVVAISAELKQRITAALENVTKDMLQRVWHEFDYQLDVCRVTGSAHIDHVEIWSHHSWKCAKPNFLFSFNCCSFPLTLFSKCSL